MSDNTETAILAGGCFWGVEELLRHRDGVISTRVGYTGGENDHPTYRNHPGHAEAVEIVFDPERISYRDILEFFFQIHDPSTKDRQGNDLGSSYRSEIFSLERRAAPGRGGDDRRRRRLGPLARQGGDRDQRGRPLLGGRAGAPGLPAAVPQRLHLPLPAAGLEAAPPRDGRVDASAGRQPGRSGIGSASAARHAGGSNGSAKYWVSWATRPPENSMMLTEWEGAPS